MIKLNGIDVSRWQNIINWERASYDTEFAIVRSTSGMSIDSRAHNNLLALNKADVPCGVYAFSYATSPSTAVKEAQNLLKFVENYRIEYPIFFDWEEDSKLYLNKQGITLTPQSLRNIASAFCNEIENAGYFAGVYANKVFYDLYGKDFFNRYALWYAHWNPRANVPKEAKMWQYSNQGKVDGITGAVDLDSDLVGLANIIRKAKLNHI